jgi:endoglucanase
MSIQNLIRASSPQKLWAAGGPLKGVSLGAGDFGAITTAQVDYFVSKGFNIFRLPFAMENACATPGGTSLSSIFTSWADVIVPYITVTKGCWAILDPHNNMRFAVGATIVGNGNVTGGTEYIIGETSNYTAANFESFWGLVATRYSGSKVIYELNNEPNGCNENTLISTLNSTIAYLRTAGHTNLILVPSNSFDGAWYGWDQGLNGNMMLQIVDPGGNYAYVVHQYFDQPAGYSGTTTTCTVGSHTTLNTVIAWARKYGKRLFLGEFAGANNTQCDTEVTAVLQIIDNNKDVWMGWSWWYSVTSQTSYLFQMLPDSFTNGGSIVDKPQMAWLTPFIGT